MSHWGVELVIGKLATDENFRQQLEERGAACLKELRDRGIDLNDDEMTAIAESDPTVWSALARRIDRRLRRPAPCVGAGAPSRCRITRRETEVLRGVLKGLSNKELASALNVSESAIKATLQHIFRKAQAHTRAQLLRRVMEGALENVRLKEDLDDCAAR
jgi:two-component system nitrate/nitrite response regulator NarL